MDKLIELDSAGVVLVIYSPSFFGYQHGWDITARKDTLGVKLEINVKGHSLEKAVEEVYDKWIAAARGLPWHGLRQLPLQAEASGAASGGEPPTGLIVSDGTEEINLKKGT